MIKYLIEDRRTNKWVKMPQSFDDMMIDTSRSYEDEEDRKWTNDPLLAMAWNTFAEAEEHNKKFWNMADIEVTEHEFTGFAPYIPFNNANFMQVIEQTDEEKLEMYMKCPKEELAKMLIQCNKHIKQFTTPIKAYSLEDVYTKEQAETVAIHMCNYILDYEGEDPETEKEFNRFISTIPAKKVAL